VWQLASAYGKLGNIDANTGDAQTGWDTDQFLTDPKQALLVAEVILKQGGLAPGAAPLRCMSLLLHAFPTAAKWVWRCREPRLAGAYAGSMQLSSWVSRALCGLLTPEQAAGTCRIGCPKPSEAFAGACMRRRHQL
jgi:hypothetical protein